MQNRLDPQSCSRRLFSNCNHTEDFLMQGFIEHLKKGEFRMPVCNSCGSKAWPPSSRCPHCLSKTSLKKIETTGTLIEFTSSHVKGKEGVFGLVDMSGIK